MLRYAAWETLAFHTHLLTSLNSHFAGSSLLPWPWGEDVHRPHGEDEHMQRESLTQQKQSDDTYLWELSVFINLFTLNSA